MAPKPKPNSKPSIARALFYTALAGGFGGAAPSLIKLAGLAQAEKLPEGGFYLGMTVFALLGGGVAAIYREDVSHKAFLLGVSAPALIVTATTVGDQTSGANVRPVAALSWLVPAAHAQAPDSPDGGMVAPGPPGDAPVDVPSGTPTVIVVPADVRRDFSQIVFKFADGSPSGQAMIVKDLDAGAGSVAVPAATTEIRLRGADGDSELVRLPTDAGSRVVVETKTDASFLSGFYQALGMENRAKKEIKVEVMLKRQGVSP